MTEPETKTDYRVDLIETELLRAGTEGLGKEELQAAVGLGVTDLRDALEQAIEQGVAVADDDGYRAGPMAGTVGADPDPAGDAADELVDEEDEEAGPESVPRAESSYRVRIVMDVSFGVDEAGGDAAAIHDAKEIAAAARAGVQEAWPDLAVSSAVAAVDAFSSPRRVFP